LFQYRGTRKNFINYKKAEVKARNVLKINEKPFINFTQYMTRFIDPSYIWSKTKAAELPGQCK
jgi:hypothetical protein